MFPWCLQAAADPREPHPPKAHACTHPHPPQRLLRLPPPLGFESREAAEAEAVGVELNRLQNIVVTLDKARGDFVLCAA